MPFGYFDTQYIDFPPNIDQNYIRGLQNQRGVSFVQVLQQIDQRLAAANAFADPLVAALLAGYTTEANVDGTTPTAFGLEVETEYGLPRPELPDQRGHMLAIQSYFKGLGYTEQMLETATANRIIQGTESMALTFTRGARINVLKRLFSIAEVPVDRSTTATSPGFAGSGSGSNVFSGTYPDGTALPGSYTLYARDTSANLATVLKSQRDKLKKWHTGPFDLVASQAQIDAIKALGAPDFVAAESSLILRAQGSAAANVDAAQFVGVFDGDVRVWHGLNELGTSPNIAIFKTYGAFDPRNALIWRYDADRGRAIAVRYRSFYPLDLAVMRQKYGVNVNNRTSAAPITIAASGNYADPAIA